jgi:hypothetical protein
LVQNFGLISCTPARGHAKIQRYKFLDMGYLGYIEIDCLTNNNSIMTLSMFLTL